MATPTILKTANRGWTVLFSDGSQRNLSDLTRKEQRAVWRAVVEARA